MMSEQAVKKFFWNIQFYGYLPPPETNSSPLKNDGWKMQSPFGIPYFQVQTDG